jgi:hypothetical protein
MKKIFKYMIPCLAVAFSLTSCNDTMDDKAVIDAKYEVLDNPTFAMSSAAASTYESATLTGTVASGLENVQEVGFQVSTDAQFTEFTVYPADEVAPTFTVDINGLEERTTYYARSYVYTKNGQILLSDAVTFTTPKAPIYSIDGTYTVVETDVKTGNTGDPYEMTVTFDETNPAKVYIYNIWGGGETVIGQYNASTNTILVPANQNIYYYPGYGYVIARSVNDAFTAYVNATTFKFTPLGGTMVSGIMEAYLPAASYSFGFFTLSMKHNDDEAN